MIKHDKSDIWIFFPAIRPNELVISYNILPSYCAYKYMLMNTPNFHF